MWGRERERGRERKGEKERERERERERDRETGGMPIWLKCALPQWRRCALTIWPRAKNAGLAQVRPDDTGNNGNAPRVKHNGMPHGSLN